MKNRLLFFALTFLVGPALFLVHTSIATAAEPIGVNLQEVRSFSKGDRTKLDRVMEVFHAVVNSEEFASGILNFETCTTVKSGRCVETVRSFYFRKTDEAMTNDEVLRRIQQGTENFYKEPKYNPPAGNGIADFFLRSYYSRKNVIGYTYSGRRTISINERYLDSKSPGYMAGNLVHEWLHKMGFKHSFNKTRLRAYSVPYGIGNLARQITGKLTGEKLTGENLRSETEESTESELEHIER